MAVIGLCTGTTADWQAVSGKLILLERELGVEITDDGYRNIRQGDGKSDFFDLPIIVNNKRYEEILKLIEGYDKSTSVVLKNVTDLADKAQKSATDSKTSADNAKLYADNAKASADDSKSSADNASVSEGNSKTSEMNAASSAADAKSSAETAKSLLDEATKKVVDTIFSVNFETGELEYDSPSYDFKINETTGELEWEVKTA